jgi:hypothetical protein
LHDVVENKPALIEFSNHKFSIPPRRDLNADELASLASDGMRATYQEFTRCNDGANGCKLLLAVSGLGPPPGADPCFDEMDALLALAVRDVTPAQSVLDQRSCNQPFPSSSQEAEKRLIQLLLGVAQRRFAEVCR